jgi:hypothetical protein
VIFSADLAAKVSLGTKTVTRRPVKRDRDGHVVACTYVVGGKYAVQLHRGGFSVDRIRILDVRRETIVFPIEWREARLEGFDSPADFRQKWAALYGPNGPLDVWRIEFELAPMESTGTTDAGNPRLPDPEVPA